MSTLKVYVGYDNREQIAFDVCVHSIQSRSDVNVIKLASEDIHEYVRPYANQSTDFTYSRFFVPFLNNFEGYAIFCDCDFIFLDDPKKLLQYINPELAVSVVKHPMYVPNSDIKMDNVAQITYRRKNWSSLMVFNCEHPLTRILAPAIVNKAQGSYLHQFQWVPDKYIGSIPIDWNCLDDYYHVDNPKAIHYTDGGPWFPGYEDTMYSKHWYNEYNNLQFKLISE